MDLNRYDIKAVLMCIILPEEENHFEVLSDCQVNTRYFVNTFHDMSAVPLDKTILSLSFT